MADTSAARIPSGRLALAAAGGVALGPLDGRYSAAVGPLVDYLSEAALNRDRVAVEVEWLIHLTGNGVLIAAGALFAFEFVADKIPYIDSAWDAISTVIRPTIGAIVAALVAGQASDLHQALASIHETIIMRAPEHLENPLRPGGWKTAN